MPPDARPGLVARNSRSHNDRVSRRQAIRQSWSLLAPNDRRRFALLVLGQVVVSLLDLLGLLLIGAVGVLAVSAIEAPSIAISLPTSLAWVSIPADASPLELVVTAAAGAATAFTLRSALSTLLIHRIYRFLAKRQASVAASLTDRLLQGSLGDIGKRSSQETANAVVDATNAAIVVVLGSAAAGFADFAILLVLTTVLFVTSPALTIGALLLFAGLAFSIQRVLGRMASRAGGLLAATRIQATESIQEAVAAFRELSVSGTRALVRDTIEATLRRGAVATADSMFVTQVPRYMFETALVVGALALLLVQLGSQGTEAAIATLTIFLAGGSRVLPSVLRLQVSLILIQDFGARAVPAYKLAVELPTADRPLPHVDPRQLTSGFREGHPGFVGLIELHGVGFTYPGMQHRTIENVSLNVPPGTTLAIVGRTGAGKSTLADLMVGLLEPDVGAVCIGGLRPAEAIFRWPGAISYVPQNVTVFAGSARQNVALGLEDPFIDDEWVWHVLELAQLASVIADSDRGLDSHLGEGGVRLSGGQRQRLGLARALFSRPRVVVLDEATSALDAETEAAISVALAKLSGQVTRVFIAHRLATIRNADQVAYMDEGRLVGLGSFSEVRQQVPAFARQASILGL